MTLSAERAYPKAVSLSVALELYSRTELWDRFATLRSRPLGFATHEFISIPLGDGGVPESDSPLGTFRGQQLVFGQLVAEFIEMMSDGKLSGVGYRVPKLRGDKPVWIPANNWQRARIDWKSSERGEVNFSAAQYRDVRIVASQGFIDEMKRLVTGTNRGTVKLKKRRPSREAEIIAAWGVLVKEGQVPDAGYLCTIFGPVRSKVHEMYPEGRPDNVGLGDKVLYRELGPLWNARREAADASKNPNGQTQS